MTVDINVLLAIGIGISFYLHYKQSKKNEQPKVEHHTYNYFQAEIIEDEEEWRM